jgi:D-glycerate 3-kinase
MKVAQEHSLKIKKKYLSFLKKQEAKGEPFRNKIQQLKNFYLPISNLIHKDYIKNKKTLIVGLSGGQGSGKSTITQILKIILQQKFKINVTTFSIDDFYKTRNQRKQMARKISKMFFVRGVPGTHDTKLLKKCLNLLNKKNFKPFYLPKFDKSIDDRYVKKKWYKVSRKPQIVIFEGWCVGAKYQNNKMLKKPINLLEKKYDKQLIWRKKVNNELKNNYQKIFKLINSLIFLQVPSFEYVYKWRLLQETKLKKNSKGKKIMSQDEIKNFIMYYERTTRQMLKDLKKSASMVIKLDKKHKLCNIKFN